MKLALSQSLADTDSEFRHRLGWGWAVAMLVLALPLPFVFLLLPLMHVLDFVTGDFSIAESFIVFLVCIGLTAGLVATIWLFNWFRYGLQPEGSGKVLYRDNRACGETAEPDGSVSRFRGGTQLLVTDRELLNLPWFPLDRICRLINVKASMFCRLAKTDILAVRVEPYFYGRYRKYHLTYAGTDGQRAIMFMPYRYEPFEKALDPDGRLRAENRWRDPSQKRL